MSVAADAGPQDAPPTLTDLGRLPVLSDGGDVSKPPGRCSYAHGIVANERTTRVQRAPGGTGGAGRGGVRTRNHEMLAHDERIGLSVWLFLPPPFSLPFPSFLFF